MKKITLIALTLVFILNNSYGQAKTATQKKGYKLTFIDQSEKIDPALKDKLIQTFFEVYPKLSKEYNKHTSKNVAFVIDTAYTGVAATGNDTVVFSYRYLKMHPADIDVVTHEVMHIVQAYGDNAGPVWLTEGIADYARYKFGVNNAGAKWSLPAYKPTQNYDNSYRITARFLVWIEQKITPGIVKTFDAQLRDHKFSSESWKVATGKTLDELWAAYSANPVI